jgi:putative transposase
MPRKNILLSSYLPYHVTARCINREWFNLPLADVWRIMENYLKFINSAYNIKIHSFVLMPNHFHLIVRSPDSNLSQAMNYFMRETSRQIGAATGRINQVYGNRFHRTAIDDAKYYYHAYKYVYRNPVKAGLTSNVEDYPYSTLSGIIGRRKIFIPIEEDNLLFSSPLCEKTLDWLNRKTSKKNDDSLKLALRRRVFQLPRETKTRLPNRLEREQY